MNYVQLLEKVKEELTHFFHIHEKPPLFYHNFGHTKSVVSCAGQIGRHYKLNDHDFFVLITAAWFHDAGYYTSGAVNHEIVGAEMAADFLKELKVDDKTIDEVRQCILATIMPQSPNTLVEKIICDADLYHFGTGDFPGLNKMMRKEAELRLGQKIPKQEWRNSSIKLLESHHFKTEYAQNLLEEQKQLNIAELKQKNKEELEAEQRREQQQKQDTLKQDKTLIAAKEPRQPAGDKPQTTVKAPKDKDKPNRGIETMFRISSSNHQRLSDMADNKAHIMITTTSIIVSVLLSVLLRKLEDNPHLVFPTIFLLVICVVTMVFSILATRPYVPNGTFNMQDIEDKKVNLLFFGNFYRMSYDAYNEGMKQMMNDSEFLYGSLTRDLYSQGVVLGRKYRLLRKAYNIFMYGIVLAVLAFTVAATLFK